MAFVGPISENIDDAQSAGMRVAGGGQVLSFDEIDNLTAESGKPAETLMNLVALVARRFQTDVCSAYLLEPDRANLVLAAMLGLRLSCVGHLRMALNEGLAGLVAEQVSPVAVEQVNRHPRFKYFSEARTLDRFIAPTQERLWALARNLWWSWDHDSTSLHAGGSSIRIPSLFLRKFRLPASNGARERWSCRVSSIMPIGASASTWRRTALGACGTPASCGRGR